MVQREYTDAEERDPTNHGTLVSGLATPFARAASYGFYRFLGGSAPKYGTDLLEPLRDAAEDGIDILNVSAGFPCDDSGGFRVRRAVRAVTERGTLVVAASGNDDVDGTYVACPARCDEAIAVGGFVPECTASIADPSADHRLWVDTGARDGFPDLQGPLCSSVGCATGVGCERNRTDRWWEHNLRPTDGKPDVLAPVHTLARDESGPYLVAGTSFSSPIVTGVVAAALGDLDVSPPPETVRRGVRQSALQIDEGYGRRLNASGLTQFLASVRPE